VERERIVEEARTAFGLNEAVFAELAARVQRPG
jgi:heme oxygenase